MKLINHPVLCNYYLTYRCNATCGFCDIWEKPSPYITLENFKENIRDLKKLGVKVIDFTGGEPLLHRELDQLLALAKKEGFITTVTTNCLLYPKYAERLKGKIDMLHFSVDSPDEEEHNQSRGVKCFDKVLDSIEIAKKNKERPDILFTVFEENVDKIERVWKEICRPNNLVLILNPVFEYNNVETGESLSAETLKKLVCWGKQKNVYLNEAFIELRKNGGNKIENPVCKAASTTIVISPENKLILPCYHLGTKDFQIKNNLLELYKSKEVQEIVALEGRLKECEGCVINCYMQPSFSVEINKYFWKALPSTLKYNYIKGTWKELF
ncbi:Radical SAM domain protein [Emticicia oligotrophica DSM 17448]|uniref:Radical SAM domain protein n=1 Tax=Emticicia oligotrophica (strain DSM 17448 / CIP 109782 / MTCC 6937 / GPTSA100-15) TaxID=929562 RepID=A0ABN4AL78_EMTOG|nr:radical SAM protein [Emticicia oligotrophica]AFK03066.1 Radical SAM domain protein [Emticicia oligotrophica DSM 17448]